MGDGWRATLEGPGPALHGPCPAAPRSIGVILGSFDPLHLGHEWMVEELLSRCERVLLLVPTAHFEKTPRPVENATFAERLEMIARVYPPGGRVVCGLTGEVLFLRLARRLGERFPGVEIRFGVGSDTFAKLERSRSYFDRLGLAWDQAEARGLAELRAAAVVFCRGGTAPRELGAAGAVAAPEHVRGISSTRIRALARDLHALHAPAATWHEALGPFVEPPLVSFIRERGLYRPSGHGGVEDRARRADGDHLVAVDPDAVEVVAAPRVLG